MRYYYFHLPEFTREWTTGVLHVCLRVILIANCPGGSNLHFWIIRFMGLGPMFQESTERVVSEYCIEDLLPSARFTSLKVSTSQEDTGGLGEGGVTSCHCHRRW